MEIGNWVLDFSRTHRVRGPGRKLQGTCTPADAVACLEFSDQPLEGSILWGIAVQESSRVFIQGTTRYLMP